MKKALLMLMGALLALPSLARDFTYTYEGRTLTYTVLDEEAKTCKTKAGSKSDLIRGYAGNKVEGRLIIPSEAKDGDIDYTVTTLGFCAFTCCPNLTSVVIPESVTCIDSYAFSSCYGLTSVVIPESVTCIDSYAFSGCSGLTSVVIPESVTRIGDNAFSSCYGLTSVVIPESVTRIGDNAFAFCYGLTSVVIPESVTCIDSYAFSDCRGLTTAVILGSKIESSVFRGCTNLTSVEIGSSVASISPYAFTNCPNLTEISVDDQNKNYSTVNGVLFDYDKTTITLFLPKSGTHYEIPNSVTAIGACAFDCCSSLSSIDIPNSVTTIGSSAFKDCSKITSINIPNSVLEIGDNAFKNCKGLKSINLPESVKAIGSSAFSDCSSLTTLTIPDSVSTINDNTFYNCSSLTAINLPNPITNIGASAFLGCKSLTAIEIPDSVTNIGASAFYCCSRLAAIVIPDSVTSIGVRAFSGCSRLTELIIPNAVTTIGEDAFNDCTSLTSVLVGKGVKSFVDGDGYHYYKGSIIFENCKNIKKGAYPKKFSRLFEKSGASSSSLVTCAYDPEISTVEDGLVIYPDGDTKIVLGFALAEGHCTVPDSITAIGDKAFAYCDSLSSIIISPYVTEVGEDVFMECNNLQKGAYPDAIENPFGEDVLAICFDAYDSAVENDFVYSRRKNALYFAPLDIESSFTVPETVTEITDNAFGLCSTLESVVLPEGLTKLGTKVWDGCPDIMHVVCKSAEPAAATRDLFQVGVYDKATLYVPKGSRAKYESAVPWKYFYNITEDEFNGLEEVEAEIGTIREEAGAEVFNLNGVRVATGGAEGLPAGIYIVRQGAKTEKIVVR